MEANQQATGLLQKGTVVDGVEGWNQGRGCRSLTAARWAGTASLEAEVHLSDARVAPSA